MKKNLVIIFLVVYSCLLSAQGSDKRLTPFLKDRGIINKVAHILDFVDSSTTLKLSDNPTYFISLGLADLKYTYNSKKENVESEGIFNFTISNKISKYKNGLQSIRCYKINGYTYLIVYFGNNSGIEKHVLNDNAIQCDCNKLSFINENIQPLPQSTFSYAVNNNIPLLFEAASFDALEFLKIEFLGEQ